MWTQEHHLTIDETTSTSAVVKPLVSQFRFVSERGEKEKVESWLGLSVEL